MGKTKMYSFETLVTALCKKPDDAKERRKTERFILKFMKKNPLSFAPPFGIKTDNKGGEINGV